MPPSRDELQYLSAVAKFNSERRSEIRRFLEFSLKNEEGIDSIESIRDWVVENYDTPENEFEGEFLRRTILLNPEDVIPQDHQIYLLSRYVEVENDLEMAGGFSPSSLLSFESLLHDEIILNRAENLGLRDRVEKPDNYEAFSEPSHIVEPPQDFIDKWAACITFQIQEVLTDFTSRVVPIDESDLIETAHSASRDILEFLSYNPSLTDSNEFQFLLTPIFPVNDDEIVVPFPGTLISTAHYRIENHLSNNNQVQQLENQTKGAHVEALTSDVLSQIPAQNYINEIHYVHDPREREADGLLLFEDSYWTIEIKSHPMFRRVPAEVDKVRTLFNDKVEKGAEQSFHFLEYLRASISNLELLYNLTGDKTANDMESGSIIVLDGYLPTFYSDNERLDKQTGFGSIHDLEPRPDRLFIISLYDLFQLSKQPEVDKFEEFLLWRTGFDGNHPIRAFNERDYWAYYFDIYRNDPNLQESLESAAERDISTIYISERFNSKDHLENIARERSFDDTKFF